MVSFKDALGYTIRTERLHQDLPMRKVANNAHIAYSYLSDVERGVKDVSSSILSSIAHALGLSTSQLVQKTCDVLVDWEEQRKEVPLWDSALIRM